MGELLNLKGQTVDDAVHALIIRVGERVRKAREIRGIPRRVLSEISGVSPRYLAQLETGEGNISIGLLQRVAVALDCRIDWLISEEDPWSSDVLQATELFRAADPDLRARVLHLLSPKPATDQRAQRICLIGLRGAGKSTLGEAAGKALDLPFIELNREVEKTSGMPVNEVLALYGQEGYRRLEAKALERTISSHSRMILAVAGGLVAEPETYALLLRHFHTIWIKARPQEHMDRVRAQGDTRPMAGNPEAMEQLKSILSSREALYERASAQVDTSGKTVELSLIDLLAVINDHGFLV